MYIFGHKLQDNFITRLKANKFVSLFDSMQSHFVLNVKWKEHSPYNIHQSMSITNNVIPKR